MTPDPLCTVIEAAAWFKVSPKTIRTWVARYKVESVPLRNHKLKHYRFSDLVAADRRARGLPPIATVALAFALMDEV